jgi:hypothetical protein
MGNCAHVNKLLGREETEAECNVCPFYLVFKHENFYRIRSLHSPGHSVRAVVFGDTVKGTASNIPWFLESSI